jgi:hypothetical protein
MSGTALSATELIFTSSYTQVFAAFEELDLRLANNPRLAHSLAQCRRGGKSARLICVSPAAEDGQVVRCAAVTQDLKTQFAAGLAPLRARAHGSLPFCIISDFMTYEDV